MPVTVASYSWRHFPTISPMSWESLGAYGWSNSGQGNNATAWPAANEAYLIPFSTWERLTIVEVWAYPRTDTVGNFDIGIYDSLGVTRLTSLGTTAKGTADVVQTTTTFTDYVLPAGDYYMAMAMSGTSNWSAWASGITIGMCQAAGVLVATTAFVLPATITPAVATRAFIPNFGITFSTLGL